MRIKDFNNINSTYMSNETKNMATVFEPKGKQGRENPTPVNTLSKNLPKRG